MAWEEDLRNYLEKTNKLIIILIKEAENHRQNSGTATNVVTDMVDKSTTKDFMKEIQSIAEEHQEALKKLNANLENISKIVEALKTKGMKKTEAILKTFIYVSKCHNLSDIDLAIHVTYVNKTAFGITLDVVLKTLKYANITIKTLAPELLAISTVLTKNGSKLKIAGAAASSTGVVLDVVDVVHGWNNDHPTISVIRKLIDGLNSQKEQIELFLNFYIAVEAYDKITKAKIALFTAVDYQRFGSSKDDVKFSTGSATFGEAKKSANILTYMDEKIPNDIDELKNLLKHELQVNSNYRDAWKQAKKMFKKNRKMEKYTALRRKNIPDEYHIALMCYVLNAIYQKFNEETRNVKTEEDFKKYMWKSLFKFLSLACNNMVGYPEEYPKGCTVYRGFSGTHSDAKKGKLVVFQNFTSATQDIEIAKRYAVSYHKHPTVFVFKGYIPRAIGLEHHLSEHNKEILLSPYNSYIIKDIKEEEGFRYIYLKA